jgi:hypothetical protein
MITVGVFATIAALITGARFESDCGDKSKASGFCETTVWARLSCSNLVADERKAPPGRR